MSESGPSRLYECQRIAFQRRDHILNARVKTNSTPTTPPVEELPDVEALCKLKQEIIENLPTQCVHCQALLPSGSIVELKDGAIMAYCKLKGACGRSQVLFAGVDLSVSTFAQVCPFKSKTAEFVPELISTEGAADSEELNLQTLEPPTSYSREITMEDHNPTCALCGERRLSHHNDCDENGWRVVMRRPIVLPPQWPRFSSVTGTWHYTQCSVC